MRIFALLTTSLALSACSQQAPQSQGVNGTSANLAKGAPAGNEAAGNEAAGGSPAAAPASSDPVALAAANLARIEAGRRDDGIPPLEQVYPEIKGMPADVQEYIVKHAACTHWGGEEGFDAERRKQIEEGVARDCPGIDQLGRQVRSRYAGNAQVLDRIKGLEPVEN